LLAEAVTGAEILIDPNLHGGSFRLAKLRADQTLLKRKLGHR
ncbi:MAG: hypothetical protein ACI9CV_001948, partial [Ilumatobacter sp.]